jgi:hypothetical protein
LLDLEPELTLSRLRARFIWMNNSSKLWSEYLSEYLAHCASLEYPNSNFPWRAPVENGQPYPTQRQHFPSVEVR